MVVQLHVQLFQIKVTINAVEILDSVEEWPMDVIQEQSNTLVECV